MITIVDAYNKVNLGRNKSNKNRHWPEEKINDINDNNDYDDYDDDINIMNTW